MYSFYDLGFCLNHSKPDRLSQLYYVKCFNNDVVYANGEVRKQAETARSKSIETRSNSSNSNQTNSSSPTYFARGSSRLPNKVNGVIEIDDKIEVLSLQFNEDLNLIATGDSDGRVQIYDVFSGQPVNPTKDPLNEPTSTQTGNKFAHSVTHNMPIICMKWHPESYNTSHNLLYYAHVNGYIGILNRDTMKKLVLIEESDELACIDFNIDGSCLASVGKDFTIRLYDSNISSPTNNTNVKSYGMHNLDIHNQELIQQSPSTNLYHTSRLQCVKFSNMSNDVLFTGGWDRTVKIWDKRTQHGLVNTMNGPFICGSDAIDVCVSVNLIIVFIKNLIFLF
jgi:WD40 repeat protein